MFLLGPIAAWVGGNLVSSIYNQGSFVHCLTPTDQYTTQCALNKKDFFLNDRDQNKRGRIGALVEADGGE